MDKPDGRGGKRPGAGRPKGSLNKTTKGQCLRELMADHGHDVDEFMLNLIVNNRHEWVVMKELLPYLYQRQPQAQHITTNESVPMLVVTAKQVEADE